MPRSTWTRSKTNAMCEVAGCTSLDSSPLRVRREGRRPSASDPSQLSRHFGRRSQTQTNQMTSALFYHSEDGSVVLALFWRAPVTSRVGSFDSMSVVLSRLVFSMSCGGVRVCWSYLGVPWTPELPCLCVCCPGRRSGSNRILRSRQNHNHTVLSQPFFYLVSVSVPA